MSLNLFSLNVEGHKHLQRWLPFAQSNNFDVVLLQEVFEQDINLIAGALQMQSYFCPLMNIAAENKYKIPPLGRWGIALFTNLEHTPPQSEYYFGTEAVLNFGKPNDSSRAILSSELQKEGQVFRVGTTHFTWTPDGENSAEQDRDFSALEKIVGQHIDWILAGDFNAPRGKETFTKFKKFFKDNLPRETTSTLDPELHYAGKLNLAVDTVFTTPHYMVEEIAVKTGLSDHCGLAAKIARVDATTS
jgi:endonuclease/exonuclease/phosphatase family metal-dependent hydrolase